MLKFSDGTMFYLRSYNEGYTIYNMYGRAIASLPDKHAISSLHASWIFAEEVFGDKTPIVDAKGRIKEVTYEYN